MIDRHSLRLLPTIMALSQKRRRGNTKPLSDSEMNKALDEAIFLHKIPEAAFLYLVDTYEFDLVTLKTKIKGL